MFYKTEEALKRYLSRFYIQEENNNPIRKTKNELIFETDHIIFHCMKGLGVNARGRKAHLISVQEDLTWQDKWPEIRDCILNPVRMSPIDIQVFDGITSEDAEYMELQL